MGFGHRSRPLIEDIKIDFTIYRESGYGYFYFRYCFGESLHVSGIGFLNFPPYPAVASGG
jgi:hypothetical protein